MSIILKGNRPDKTKMRPGKIIFVGKIKVKKNQPVAGLYPHDGLYPANTLYPLG